MEDYTVRTLLTPLPIFQALISSNQGGDTKLPRGNGLETAETLNIFNSMIQCATDIPFYGLSADIYQLKPAVRMGCENRRVLYIVQDESHSQEHRMEISNLSDHQ